MTNLTQSEGLALRLGEASPRPGYELVLFERSAEHGLIYKTTVEEGQPVPKAW